jgi:uncharacterized protein YkwD
LHQRSIDKIINNDEQQDEIDTVTPETPDEIPDSSDDQDDNLDEYKVDKQKAAQYWMDLNNDERESRGLYDYTFDSRLNTSAQNWSEYQKSISTATHTRNPNDAYYEYQKITNWLASE